MKKSKYLLAICFLFLVVFSHKLIAADFNKAQQILNEISISDDIDLRQTHELLTKSLERRKISYDKAINKKRKTKEGLKE